MNKSVTLKVNGQEIPMNPFVKEVFMNVFDGLVNTLDKIPEVRNRIEVIIEKK